MTGDTWGPHHGCPEAEVRSLWRTAEAGQRWSPLTLCSTRTGLVGFPPTATAWWGWWPVLTSPSSVGRREDGEEGIAFETEEERQQWEDDQRVGAWGAGHLVNAGLRTRGTGRAVPRGAAGDRRWPCVGAAGGGRAPPGGQTGSGGGPGPARASSRAQRCTSPPSKLTGTGT